MKVEIKFKQMNDPDTEADNFLRKYWGKELKQKPHPVPIRQIADKIQSLKIVETECLSQNHKICATFALTHGFVDVFDCEKNEILGFHINSPTIFIDSFILNNFQIELILAWGCYIYDRYNTNSNLETSGAVVIELTKNDLDLCTFSKCYSYPHNIRYYNSFNLIDASDFALDVATKILLPSVFLEEYMFTRYHDFYNPNVSPYNQRVASNTMVTEIAKNFKILNSLASKRLIDLGVKVPFELFEDKNLFFDSKTAREPTKAKSHYQKIDLETGFRIFSNNLSLQNELKKDNYLFIDGYFVKNEAKYIYFSDSKLTLTEYAQSHLDECTLDFSQKYVSSIETDKTLKNYLKNYYTSIISFEDNNLVQDSFYEIFSSMRDGISKDSKNALDLFEFKEIIPLSTTFSKSSSEVFLQLFEKYDFDRKQIIEQTMLNDMYIHRLRKNHKFSVRYYTAMALALRLGQRETESILRLSGLGYDRHNVRDLAYCYLLNINSGTELKMEECNEFLESLGLKPFGTISSEKKSKS